MNRGPRINEAQLILLAEKAASDYSLCGYLRKRCSDSDRWQQRWFVLYQNYLFYYETESIDKPSGVLFLEGCYCDRLAFAASKMKSKDYADKQYCFVISYKHRNMRQYELKADNDLECNSWIEAIREASYNKIVLLKEELEQKHAHLLRIVEAEKTIKWEYTKQLEDMNVEIMKLRNEVQYRKATRFIKIKIHTYWEINTTTGQYLQLYLMKRNWRPVGSTSNAPCTFCPVPEESAEIKKIKKVQSFFRGWLCRRRWKQIVEQYIKSPHAENMRKRNNLVFKMVEAEEEYTKHLQVLVSCFFRPMKMAASSKKPPCTHEDINSIFLNSETVLFLHQIFLKGLMSRLEHWPTLVLGDLFSILLPMLGIYQEYVRNHHFALQVLTECKQTPAFAQLVKRLESKTVCQGRTLEQFLTYPMHQVPRYIITLHELLAHTPHDHVERNSLLNARQRLEDLSRQMHEEISETENLRKNLSIERMIVEGCDILLDANQIFVRQGTLLHLANERSTRSKYTYFNDKDAVRQCFLFSNHLIMTMRTSNGNLHLVKNIGKTCLANVTLIEDPPERFGASKGKHKSRKSCNIPEACGSRTYNTVIAAAASAAKTVTVVVSKGAAVAVNAAIDPDHTTFDSLCDSTSDDFSIKIDQHHHQLQPSFDASPGRKLDFKLIVELNEDNKLVQYCIHLMATTTQEKAAWISDLSQCLANVQENKVVKQTEVEASSTTVVLPQMVKFDQTLFKDEPDIRFSHTRSSARVPDIRYATPERLLLRLTDLRYLSIDFMNTFLLTYRVFCTGNDVLEALQKLFRSIDLADPLGSVVSLEEEIKKVEVPEVTEPTTKTLTTEVGTQRRISIASSVSGYCSDRSHSYDSQGQKHWKCNLQKYDEEPAILTSPNGAETPTLIQSPSVHSIETVVPNLTRISITVQDESSFLTIPKPTGSSSSSDSLTDITVISAPRSPSAISTKTLTDTSPSESKDVRVVVDVHQPCIPSTSSTIVNVHQPCTPSTSSTKVNAHQPCTPSTSSTMGEVIPPKRPKPPPPKKTTEIRLEGMTPQVRICNEIDEVKESSFNTATTHQLARTFRGRTSSVCTALALQHYYGLKKSMEESQSSDQSIYKNKQVTKVGVSVTSVREEQGRGNKKAASAYAMATSASSNPKDVSPKSEEELQEKLRKKYQYISTACTKRVLTVLRHWISKQRNDFTTNEELYNNAIEFLEDIIASPNILAAEHQSAEQILSLLTEKSTDDSNLKEIQKLINQPSSLNTSDSTMIYCPMKQNLSHILPGCLGKKAFTFKTPTNAPSGLSIDNFSALEIAEQLTLIDHQIFVGITNDEFLCQAWMKKDKDTRAPHIILMTKRFNDVSRLVISDIVRRQNLTSRVAALEKWVTIADIERCLQNFNGVLQICAALNNSAIFRLKKTWEKISRSTKTTLDKLQSIVSSDGRFRLLRDYLQKCDPPCIPYLGIYLTDLSFIEEGTPTYTNEGLLNFSKMRMVANIIREVSHLQQTRYRIQSSQKAIGFITDTAQLLDDDQLFGLSLELEPRAPRE
ncbi:PREDICTED: ras-specific guanine nucleotide-releasing factor 2-like isoform X2 [Nicrophorus vespilloides]|uniref:Ras-specific guanine nucleotide-releasing factor 2-like isoform X2 n=1 Tax=Nicrophorus vespilloides TaxID=110193 RepID=A0ABM1MBH9_NICVS|nr:PREDICTED: ras-specific guanine nucleotide-releasing factor 2-like isoform X2 [Nicrophorus vespilloides]